MPLTDCRECGEQVSTEVESCPHCGAEIPASRRAPDDASATGAFGGQEATEADSPLQRIRDASFGISAVWFFGFGAFLVMVIALLAENATESVGMAVAFLFFVWLVLFYFLPAVVAWKRYHHNTTAIAALTLFAGWTVLGWIGALIWALTAVREDVRG